MRPFYLLGLFLTEGHGGEDGEEEDEGQDADHLSFPAYPGDIV